MITDKAILELARQIGRLADAVESKTFAYPPLRPGEGYGGGGGGGPAPGYGGRGGGR